MLFLPLNLFPQHSKQKQPPYTLSSYYTSLFHLIRMNVLSFSFDKYLLARPIGET